MADAAETRSHELLENLYNACAQDEQYMKAASLLMHLLHPDVSSRATAQQALDSDFCA